MEHGALSLLPAGLTLVLAFATRRVLPALFLGIVAGGAVLYASTGTLSDLNILDRFLLPAMASESYARILLIYLWCLGGLLGVWQRTGAAEHFAKTVGEKVVTGPRSSLVFAWLVGVIFHQGGTVSTVLTGTTVKPVADRYGVAHEELAYVVDSTGSPVATIVPFNVWPAYIAGLVVGTVPVIATEADALAFYVKAMPWNFYAIFALGSTLLFGLGYLPWVGKKMAVARARARSGQGLDRPGAQPMLPDAGAEVPEGYTPALIDFWAPLVALASLAIMPYVLTGKPWINEAFGACVLTVMIVAFVRGLPLKELMDAFLEGCKAMTIGAVILGLAVTLGLVTKELDTASYVVTLIGDGFPAVALPAALSFLCMAMAFATGTSWGTYAVVFPIALPLAWALAPDPSYLAIVFGAVLGGAVFGDQCSPISDTTILSAMFAGCDLMDHVETQLPLALAAATLGAGASTVAAAVVL